MGSWPGHWIPGLEPEEVLSSGAGGRAGAGGACGGLWGGAHASPAVLRGFPVRDLEVLTRKGRVLERARARAGLWLVCQAQPRAPVSGMSTSGLETSSRPKGLLLKTYQYGGLGVSRA